MTNGKRPGKTFLRWAGSKRQLLPTLTEYWTNEHIRYVEPFAGSACFFFHIQPSAALLGDINSELICTLSQVKDHLSDVLSELDNYAYSKEFYYQLRSIAPETLRPAQRAARFIYLNRFCFNGLYRTNRQGEFNVPYGGQKCGNIPSEETLKECSRTLGMTKLLNSDFEVTLDQAKIGDFVYIDPPYYVKSKAVFNEYNQKSFSTDDMERLRGCLDKLTFKGIEFLLSYADVPDAAILKEGFLHKNVVVRRNIAGFAGKRKCAGEIVVTNKHLINN